MSSTRTGGVNQVYTYPLLPPGGGGSSAGRFPVTLSANLVPAEGRLIPKYDVLLNKGFSQSFT